jgi:hypothetical protein
MKTKTGKLVKRSSRLGRKRLENILNVKKEIIALLFSQHTHLRSLLVRVSATASVVSTRVSGDLRTPHAIVSLFRIPAFRKAEFHSLPVD